ncbi:hypothetical protein [Burkholderia sp. BE12]|uniref:hypothetical protein n=1 Tax=Burkholderia sp. BE12 TaxID=2082394 RepID=UPI000CF47E51|nr:hypothetical protein [Burkholderia sp. BE12]
MREFREVRKDLTGDEAAPYIGVARTLLGQVKNQMRLGGLSQLTRSIALPDGTTLVATSRFGQDTIRVIAAPTSGGFVPASQPSSIEQPSGAPEPFSTTIPWVPSHVAVGGAYNNTIGLTGIYWPTEKDAPIDVGASFGNSDIGQYLTSVTADGHTAVGWWGNVGVTYTRSGGLHDVPAPDVDNDPNGNGNSTAASISYDGGTVGVAVVGRTSLFAIDYAWHPKTGVFSQVPQMLVATQFPTETAIISGNGKVLAGRGPIAGGSYAIVVDIASGAVLKTIANGKVVALNYDGSVAVGCLNDGQPNVQAMIWTPTQTISLGVGICEGVSADGSVACGTFGSAWYATTGFIWTKSKGVLPIPGFSAAHCVSPCGTAIGGANATSPVVWDIHGNMTALALPAGSYIYAPTYGGVFGLAQRAPLALLGQGDTSITYPR